MQPTISIIIPAYNVERTILETIQSVQRQTFTDFELIVINDGSTDQTLHLLKNIQDDRLKVFSYENGGLPTARNRGILHATGEFITFLDGDDLWTPKKLELQLDALNRYLEAGAAYSLTFFADEEITTALEIETLFKNELLNSSVEFMLQADILPKLLLENFICSGSNIMLRRKAIEETGKFDSQLRSCEDWEYWLRVALNHPFVLVAQPQIVYRRSAGAMSSNISVMEDSLLTVIDRTIKAFPSAQAIKNQSLSWAYQYLTDICLRYSINIDEVNQGGEKLWKAIQFYPPIVLQNHTLNLAKWFLKKWITLKFSSLIKPASLRN